MECFSPSRDHVIATAERGIMTILLNRPAVLNSLTLCMIRDIRKALDKALTSEEIHMVILQGSGDKAFCAGGDIKAIASAVRENRMDEAMTFFREEYALDLCIHQFPKPIVAFSDGITMGGGLGLCAGADIVIATEKTRMAMPETRIGFFPDVGATGWLFQKCPEGYPEYLGLTGHEIKGSETFRLGFSTHLVLTKNLEQALSAVKEITWSSNPRKDRALGEIKSVISTFSSGDIPEDPDRDDWVRDYFSGKTSITDILFDLSQCSLHHDLCEGVFRSLSERSPTATVLALRLMRFNQGKSMAEVFATETKAAGFMITHRDYLEGVRARLVDKDDAPRWRPGTFEEAEKIDMNQVFT